MHKIELDPETVQRVVAWRGRRHMFEDIDPVRTAHLAIDMQTAFLEQGSELEVPEARAIPPVINRISKAVRDAGGLNVFVKFVVDAETVRTWPVWLNYFCRPDRASAMTELFAEGAEGGAIDGSIEVEDGDLIVPKSRFGAFVPGASNLHEILQARGIDTLIITGTVTYCCCESTARDAMQMNYKVIFSSDGTAALSDSDHNATLNNMLSIFADVMDVNEIESLLQRAAPPGRRVIGWATGYKPSST